MIVAALVLTPCLFPVQKVEVKYVIFDIVMFFF